MSEAAEQFKAFLTPPDASKPVTVVPKRVLVWKDGLPTPVDDVLISKAGIEQSMRAALSLKYRGYWDVDKQDWVIEAEFLGMTNIEVLAIRMAQGAANGDLDMMKQILDRTLGKPKQSVESVNMNMSYQDFLEQKAKDLNQPHTLDVNDL